MAVITENYKTRGDGVELVRTYSDESKKLVRNDGVVYDEAIDVKGIGYTYTESDEYTKNAEATEEDYQKALGEFGVTL